MCAFAVRLRPTQRGKIMQYAGIGTPHVASEHHVGDMSLCVTLVMCGWYALMHHSGSAAKPYGHAHYSIGQCNETQ